MSRLGVLFYRFMAFVLGSRTVLSLGVFEHCHRATFCINIFRYGSTISLPVTFHQFYCLQLLFNFFKLEVANTYKYDSPLKLPVVATINTLSSKRTIDQHDLVIKITEESIRHRKNNLVRNIDCIVSVKKLKVEHSCKI